VDSTFTHKPTDFPEAPIFWSNPTTSNGSVNVTGSMQGMAVNATGYPTGDDHEVGSISGTIGTQPFSARLKRSNSGSRDVFISGSYAGRPLSGTVIYGPSSSTLEIQISGTIEGQPVSGTLSSPQVQNSHTFSFSGKIGNLSVTGTAAISSKNGFTSSQHVG
jgi:hypothetical protein